MPYAKAGRYHEVSFAGGALAPGLAVTVRNPGTAAAASLWTSRDKTAAAANPVTVDASGNLSFYADPGYYDLLANGVTLPNVLVHVDHGAPAPAVEDYAVTAAQQAVLGNGVSKPLSGFYATLAAAQAAYPTPAGWPTIVTALTNELDRVVIQSALAADRTGEVVALRGGYVVEDTVHIVGCFSRILTGLSRQATRLVPTAALAGKPVVIVRNSTHSGLRHLTVAPGVPATAPSAAVESIEDHGNVASNPNGYTAGSLVLEDVILGGGTPGSGAGGIVDGVRWTTVALDQNNDYARIRNVDIYNFSGAAYNITHSNSLGHQIEGGNVAYGPTVVKLAGGSFIMDKTSIGGITSWVFDFGAGTYWHPSHVGPISHEDGGLFVRSNAAAVDLKLYMMNPDFKGGVINVTAIQWDAPAGRLTMVAPQMALGTTGIKLVASSTTSVVTIIGGETQFSAHEYAGTLILDDVTFLATTVFTPLNAAAKRFVTNCHGAVVLNDAAAPTLTPYWFDSPISHGQDVGVAAMGANEYNTFDVERRQRCNRVMFFVGTSAGLVMAKVYDAAGAEIATSGAVACPAAGGAAIAVTDVELMPGKHYVALSSNDAQATFRYRSGLGPLRAMSPVRYSGGSYPLPANVNAAADTSENAFLIMAGYV